MEVYLLKWTYCSSDGYDHGDGEIAAYTNQQDAEKAGERYLKENYGEDSPEEYGYEVVEMDLKESYHE